MNTLLSQTQSLLDVGRGGTREHDIEKPESIALLYKNKVLITLDAPKKKRIKGDGKGFFDMFMNKKTG